MNNKDHNRDVIMIDYKIVMNKLKNKVFTLEGVSYQYSIEQRGSCLHIIELNFKPNTKTTMSIPMPVYNKFVEELNRLMERGGISGNGVMGIFIRIYEDYRRKYLGATRVLKPSSYTRYASVLFGFWKCMGRYMGFECKIKPQSITKTITQDKEKMLIESETLGRGYYIKPIGKHITQIEDSNQSKLLGFVKNG